MCFLCLTKKLNLLLNKRQFSGNYFNVKCKTLRKNKVFPHLLIYIKHNVYPKKINSLSDEFKDLEDFFVFLRETLTSKY